jgi:hypothetical protein
MSLFDQFDPATFAPMQGGLIENILAQYAAAPPNAVDPAAQPQPAPGPQPAAVPAPPVVASDDDTPAAPAPQAAPIAVGGYQMPRIGPAAAFTPSPAAPQAAPAAPVQPAPSLLDTIGNHLTAASQSFGHGGGLIGGTAALLTGQRHDPWQTAQDQQQAQLQKKYAALVNAGVPQQQAMLAMLDPEAEKTIIARTFGPPQAAPQYVWQNGKAVKTYDTDAKDNFDIKTIKDGMGNETAVKINKATGETTPIPAAPGASVGSLGDMTKTGEAYLATLPPQQAGIVKAMVEGRQAPPSSFALSKPYWQNMIQAAQIYDPTFDQTKWSGRVAGVKDFTAGKSADMVKSANQTLAHVNALLDSAAALHNGNYPSVNWIGNKFNEATGGGEPGAFRTNAHAVAEEMSKVFKGANMSDAEIHAWENNLSENMSPAQQRAQIGKLSELLHGSLDALEEKRLTAIGPMAAEKQGPLIKPEGQAVLKRIDAWLKAGDGAGGTTPSGVKWSVVQ